MEENKETIETVEEETVEEVEVNPFEEENKALKEMAEKCKDLALRTQAEFDNYRKRTISDGEAKYDKGIAKAVSTLLPVVDSIERALKVYSADETKAELTEGFEAVHKQFIDVLGTLGVKQMETAGQMFDPNFHEAMLNQPGTDKESGTILDVYTTGYTLKDTVIRHAQVIVAE